MPPQLSVVRNHDEDDFDFQRALAVARLILALTKEHDNIDVIFSKWKGEFQKVRCQYDVRIPDAIRAGKRATLRERGLQ